MVACDGVSNDCIWYRMEGSAKYQIKKITVFPLCMSSDK